jgi:filamentous hemagglutinin
MAAYAVWQQRTEVGSRGTGVGGQRAEVGGQKSEVGGQRSEVGDQRSEVRKQRSEVGDQRSDHDRAATIVKSQTIRGLDGDVAYRGDVDVTATLARIKAGKLLRFGNDGATFQNRERRLPRKPAGYYKEYVHPTPGLSGPGPQRIVVGEHGETYYTPDHYETFRRLDE